MIPSKARNAPVLVPRIGTMCLPGWTPDAPRSGWGLETAWAAAWAYAGEHGDVGHRPAAMARAAFTALADAADTALGVSAADPIRHQDILQRLDGLDS